MNSNLEELRKIQEPTQNFQSLKPFRWGLDGGGKDLIKEVIISKKINLMLEIGVFFGDSVKQWLETSQDLVVIGIDPYPNFVKYFKNKAEIHHSKGFLDYQSLDYDSLLKQLDQPDGTLLNILSNLRDHTDRFIPLRGTSPEKLYEIHKLGIVPDLIYIDSDKEMRELEVCHDLFPNSIISGDDWTWKGKGKQKEQKTFPIRKPVYDFAERHGYQVISRKATWLLEK